MTERLWEPGALVAHRQRPGLWRIVGLVGEPGAFGRAVIEPWDDLAAASFHPCEAYSVTARLAMLTRLSPGRLAEAL